MSTHPKPWSVAAFEVRRTHLTTFIRESVLPLLGNEDCRRIVIRAPVKSGKREMAEYSAMRDQARNPTRVHAFLSAWHRAADADQRVELEQHNMRVFSITSLVNVAACKTWIQQQLAAGKEIVLHLDECDHGSSDRQMLSKVWSVTRADPKITNILYSATPEEVLFSGEVEDEEHQAMMNTLVTEGHHIRYLPPPGYCGPAKFLAEDLVYDAKPFFYKEGGAWTLSPQGKEIMRDLRASCAATPARNILVLRLSYSEDGNRKENKAIYQFLKNLSSFPELAGVSITVDKGEDASGLRSPLFRAEKIAWSSRQYWEDRASGRPMIIVIDQTSSRSTEWVCHDRIFATHDFRSTITFSTISQAQERTNHYYGPEPMQRYKAFQRIRIYGHKKTFQLSAGQIDYATYLRHDWWAHKVDRRTAGTEVPIFRIKNTVTNAINPLYPEAVSREQADRILQDLGCYGDVSVSARVAGRIVDRPVYEHLWFPCDKESWQQRWPAFRDDPANGLAAADGTRITMRNPFVEAEQHRLLDASGQPGLWQGMWRTWRVLDFERDIQDSTDQGATGGRRRAVCYRRGVLGVVIVRPTGEVRRMDSLRAFKSMYATE